jgi:nicotinamide-nucleotide adenylyltransferase
MEHSTDPAWQRRYDRAAHTLNSVRVVVAQQRAVERSRPHVPPRADVRSGRTALRTARHVGHFAGSFNPLTNAHVAIEEAVRAVGGLDCVVWACAAVTVDKERVERASVADRLAQLAAYVHGARGSAVALVNRGLYVEQARALRARMDRRAQLSIIVGFDKAVQIFDPRYYADRDAALRELFALARLLVSPRAGAGADDLAALLAHPENRPFARHVTFVPVSTAHAGDSSTEARRLLAASPDPLQPGQEQRALIELVAPEGLALARETGAYERSDRYAARMRLIHELAALPVAQLPARPTVSALLGGA